MRIPYQNNNDLKYYRFELDRYVLKNTFDKDLLFNKIKKKKLYHIQRGRPTTVYYYQFLKENGNIVFYWTTFKFSNHLIEAYRLQKEVLLSEEEIR